jgi:hypothetical protein
MFETYGLFSVAQKYVSLGQERLLVSRPIGLRVVESEPATLINDTGVNNVIELITRLSRPNGRKTWRFCGNRLKIAEVPSGGGVPDCFNQPLPTIPST